MPGWGPRRRSRTPSATPTRWLVGKKAEYAGDESFQSKPRTFGAIDTESIDIDSFERQFAKYGGKLATPALEYETTPGILGDPTTAQEQAPNLVTKLKNAGVTSVFLFSEIAMNSAITRAATQQEYFPEWILTGYQFADLSLLSRNYDQAQWAQAFGISNLLPYVRNAPNTLGALNWYWGENVATSSTLAGAMVVWFAAGIQYAGPTLTPKNFQCQEASHERELPRRLVGRSCGTATRAVPRVHGPAAP